MKKILLATALCLALCDIANAGTCDADYRALVVARRLFINSVDTATANYSSPAQEEVAVAKATALENDYKAKLQAFLPRRKECWNYWQMLKND